MKVRILVVLFLLNACSSDDAPNRSDFQNEDVGMDAQTNNKGDDTGANNTTDASETGSGALEALLQDLTAGGQETALALANEMGWPLAVEGGYLFVSFEDAFDKVGGDHDDFAGTAMTHAEGFSYVVLNVAPGSRYKFSDGSTFKADPWGRSYVYDEFGEMTLVAPTSKHLERFFQIGDSKVEPRRVTVFRSEGTPTHVLYTHDGQNLFAPDANSGGWKLFDQAPAGMMIVGIDNSGARMEEYTHVVDDIGSGNIGGGGDNYADFVNTTVRELIRDQYGEPAKVGMMGSSLGGLISLSIVDRFPDQYDFVASLSGTLGWGSIGLSNQTMIERYSGKGKRSTFIYVDSGGRGSGCVDSDQDGIQDDDENATDNYCENKQFESTLVTEGYAYDTDFVHWWEPDAPHNEASWAARVFRPLGIFANL